MHPHAIQRQRRGGRPNTNRTRGEPECFGCGGPHRWTEERDHNTIICTNAEKAGVRERAEINFQAFKDRMRDRRRGG